MLIANDWRVRLLRGLESDLEVFLFMKKHEFTTVEQQIEILRDRGLIFNSMEDAIFRLRKYGYYNIINGYKDNYIVKDGDTEYYKDGVSFEQIYSLFILDHGIRNMTMLVMLDIEENLKTQVAYVIGKYFSADYTSYSDIRNYKNIKIKNPRFCLKNILAQLDAAYHSDKDPIKYYRERYGNVPPWVLFKGVYLSTVVNLVRYLKSVQKEEVLKGFFAIDTNYSLTSKDKELFAIFLSLFLEYRNLCAHGGRIYNYSSPINLVLDTNMQKAIGSPCSEVSSFCKLTAALAALSDGLPFENIKRCVESEINRHCIVFPDDKDYLLTAMGINNVSIYNF